VSGVRRKAFWALVIAALLVLALGGLVARSLVRA
jgi:hypothetical protein